MHNWRILLDLDGTVAQNAGRRLAARHFGVQISEEQYGGSLTEILGLTDEQFWAWWHEHQEEIYDQAEPLAGAGDAVRLLKDMGAHIAVVTARRESAEPVTRRWLDRHGFPFDQMVFAADDKVTIARDLELNLVFEDDPNNALALADFMPVVLIDNFKNRAVEIDHPRVHRVSGWHEVHPLLRRIGEKSA